jgi:hypothetical protein
MVHSKRYLASGLFILAVGISLSGQATDPKLLFPAVYKVVSDGASSASSSTFNPFKYARYQDIDIAKNQVTLSNIMIPAGVGAVWDVVAVTFSLDNGKVKFHHGPQAVQMLGPNNGPEKWAVTEYDSSSLVLTFKMVIAPALESFLKKMSTKVESVMSDASAYNGAMDACVTDIGVAAAICRHASVLQMTKLTSTYFNKPLSWKMVLSSAKEADPDEGNSFADYAKYKYVVFATYTPFVGGWEDSDSSVGFGKSDRNIAVRYYTNREDIVDIQEKENITVIGNVAGLTPTKSIVVTD